MTRVEVKYVYDITKDAWYIRALVPCEAISPDNNRRVVEIAKAIAELIHEDTGAEVDVCDAWGAKPA